MEHTCGGPWPPVVVPAGSWQPPRPVWFRTVVFHYPCLDGSAAALLLRLLYGLNFRLLGVNHHQLHVLAVEHPQVIQEDHVLFVDIAPRYADLQQWQLRHYLILDHHKSAEAELQRVPDRHKCFDMTLSGVGLVWRYCLGAQVPMHNPFLRAIQARDLWQQQTVPHCDELNAYLVTVRNGCDSCLLQTLFQPTDMRAVYFIGRLLEAQRKARVASYLPRAAPRRWLGGLPVWLVNCADATCTSDVGAALCARHPGAVALLFSYDGRAQTLACRLRSAPDGPDVSALARRFGGGGHHSAAGFTWAGTDIESLPELQGVEAQPEGDPRWEPETEPHWDHELLRRDFYRRVQGLINQAVPQNANHTFQVNCTDMSMVGAVTQGIRQQQPQAAAVEVFVYDAWRRQRQNFVG